MVAGRIDSHGARGRRRRSSSRCVADNVGGDAQADERAYEWATDVLFEVRKQRSEAKQPLKVPITQRDRHGADARQLALMPIVEADLARGAARPGVRDVADVGEPRRARASTGYGAGRDESRAVRAARSRRSTATSCAARSPRTRRRRRHDRGDRARRRSGRAASFLVKADCVLAGLDVAFEAFRQLDPGVARRPCRSTTATLRGRRRRSPRSRARRARC